MGIGTTEPPCEIWAAERDRSATNATVESTATDAAVTVARREKRRRTGSDGATWTWVVTVDGAFEVWNRRWHDR
jgi:hypothetical protein